MQFNTWHFFYFGIIVLFTYWCFYKKTSLQNLILLASSYFFYGYMHLAFPIYLLSLTLIGYVSANILQQKGLVRKKQVLTIALILASSCLAVLKYADFIVN